MPVHESLQRHLQSTANQISNKLNNHLQNIHNNSKSGNSSGSGTNRTSKGSNSTTLPNVPGTTTEPGKKSPPRDGHDSPDRDSRHHHHRHGFNLPSFLANLHPSNNPNLPKIPIWPPEEWFDAIRSKNHSPRTTNAGSSSPPILINDHQSHQPNHQVYVSSPQSSMSSSEGPVSIHQNLPSHPPTLSCRPNNFSYGEEKKPIEASQSRPGCPVESPYSDPPLTASPANTQSIAPAQQSPTMVDDSAHKGKFDPSCLSGPQISQSPLNTTTSLQETVIIESPANTQSISTNHPLTFESPINTLSISGPPITQCPLSTTSLQETVIMESPANTQSISTNQPVTFESPINTLSISGPPITQSPSNTTSIPATTMMESPTNTQSISTQEPATFQSPFSTLSTPTSVGSRASSKRPATPASHRPSPPAVRILSEFEPPPLHPSIYAQKIGAEAQVRETLDAHSTTSQDGEKQINQYIIKQELGRGSFGAVQLAIDAETGTQYAMKELSKSRLKRKFAREIRLLNKSYDEETDALFLIRNEVAIMKKLKHPNVVRLHEVLDVAGEDSLYMVMEYCEGGPLISIDNNNENNSNENSQGFNGFDEDVARRYFRQLIVGIDYLHHNEVIHHDIKPDNILLTKDKSLIKIVDFGISAMFSKPGDDSSINSRKIGSPAFLSPESISTESNLGSVSGTAADIWAMGVTLYCMLTGNLPFGRSQIVDMCHAIQHEAPLIPEDWDGRLLDLMSNILDKDPESRIKMKDLRKHDWVTDSSKLSVLIEFKEDKKVNRHNTDSEISDSFRMGISNFCPKTKNVFKEILENSLINSYEKIYGGSNGINHGNGIGHHKSGSNGGSNSKSRRKEFFKEFYRQISERASQGLEKR